MTTETDPANSSTSPAVTQLPGTSEPPSTTATTTSSPPTTAPDIYTPPAGTYHFDVVGTTQNSGLLGGREKPLPGSSTDTVSVTPTAGGQRVTTVTRNDGEDSQQELTVDVRSGQAQLVALNQRDNGAVTVAIAPRPPAVLARLPYRVGDRWEIAWTDDATGVSGTGTGEVLRGELIETPAGEFDTVVIHVNQRLRGTVSGTLDLTAWVDRTTGIQAKQHLVTEVSGATGSSRTDAVRTLRDGPA